MRELNVTAIERGGRTVLQPASVTVAPGELIALIGPNGAGKSSWLKALAGVWPGLADAPNAKTTAYLAQHPIAPARAKVRDIIGLGRTPHLGALGRLSAEDQTCVEAAISETDLQDFTKRRYGTLSGGERARVHLARALATRAPLLLADEPTAALDPQYQLATLHRLRDYAARGNTVIVALHDLNLARRFADRVWVLQRGQLVADGPPDTAMTDNVLADVFNIRLGAQGLEAL